MASGTLRLTVRNEAIARRRVTLVGRREVCVHPYEPGEPEHYGAWARWAKDYGRTHRQEPCPTPGCLLYRWVAKRTRG